MIQLLYFCSNVQCGQLHCMSGDFQANPGVAVTITTFTIGSDVCRYVEGLIILCDALKLQFYNYTEHSALTLEQM